MMLWETIAYLILIGVLLLPFRTLRELGGERRPTGQSRTKQSKEPAT